MAIMGMIYEVVGMVFDTLDGIVLGNLPFGSFTPAGPPGLPGVLLSLDRVYSMSCARCRMGLEYNWSMADSWSLMIAFVNGTAGYMSSFGGRGMDRSWWQVVLTLFLIGLSWLDLNDCVS